jgi:hypothetical protein
VLPLYFLENPLQKFDDGRLVRRFRFLELCHAAQTEKSRAVIAAHPTLWGCSLSGMLVHRGLDYRMFKVRSKDLNKVEYITTQVAIPAYADAGRA